MEAIGVYVEAWLGNSQTSLSLLLLIRVGPEASSRTSGWGKRLLLLMGSGGITLMRGCVRGDGREL